MEELVPFKKIILRDSDFVDILKDNDLILLCRNKSTGKERHTRFSALFRNNERFWENDGWDFFITEQDRHKLIVLLDRERSKIKGEISEIVIKDKPEKELPPPFGEEYEEVVNMSMESRTEKIARAIESLDEALEQTRISSHDIASLMTDAAIYSSVINKVSMEEMSDKDDLLAQRYMHQVNMKTEELMSSFVRALSRNYNLNQTAEIIGEQTSGATSRHMNRVFILSIRFLDDLRHEFEYAGLHKRIQTRIASYLPLYESLRDRFPFARFDKTIIMPHPPRFKGKKMEEIMLGILLHDMGKNRNLLYFDGREEYNRKIIEDHAFDGYFMIMKKTAYQQSIASIAGLHHEYYGHEQGYGVLRDNYLEYCGKVRGHHFEMVLSDNYEDITNFRAAAYLPAKILEIVDVYDAMIDKDRQYKTPMSPGEALVFMRKNMIDNDLKLDPILFDLFVKFLKKAKLI